MLYFKNTLERRVSGDVFFGDPVCPQIRYWRQHEREAAADRVRTAGLEATARVSGLRHSTRYHVAVLAYNSAGTGPPSPRTTVTTRKPRTGCRAHTCIHSHVCANYSKEGQIHKKYIYLRILKLLPCQFSERGFKFSQTIRRLLQNCLCLQLDSLLNMCFHLKS